MIDSLDLRHFPQTDPPDRLTQDDIRDKIQKQVDEFIASGGQIVELSSQDYGKNPIIANKRQRTALKTKQS